MKISIKSKLIGLLAVPVLALGAVAVVPATYVAAANTDCSSTTSIQDGIDCAAGPDRTQTLFGNGSIFNNIVNTLLFVIGALSVIMLIVGGIRYTTSNGAAAQVTAAKNTIMYAIVGLVVAFLAFAIVNWVLGGLSK